MNRGSGACELYKNVWESTGSVARVFDVLAEAALSLKKRKKQYIPQQVVLKEMNEKETY